MVAVEEGLARASRPVFAARAVCYAAAAAVHVADPVSGAVLRSFRAPHSHIVSLARHQNLPSLLYSAHADAVVRLWDLSDASLLRTWNFASSIVGMVADPAHPDVFYLSFACEHAKDKKLSNKRNHIAQYILPPLAANPGAGDTPTPLAILIASNSAFVGISVSDQVVAACTDKNLWVWKNQKAQLSSTGFVKIKLPSRTYASPPKITAIAAHPLNQSVAIGLTTGEILLHHNPFDAVKSVQTLHWHAHAVLSLEFTNDGTTLASGGYESVLILWQIDTLKRKPVPRIAGGAALQSIACSSDDASLAVVCSDSCVRVISIPKLQVVACVTGLKARNGRVFSYHEGLAYDPRTASVVVSGSPGCIQFYNPHTQSHIMELEVVAQNRMVGGGFSGKDGVDKIVGEDSLATVKMVAFENDGRKSRWMATVDVRTDMAVADEEEVWLKFWQWDDVNQTYVVNTRVSSPHDGQITSMHFLSVRENFNSRVKSLLMITTSADTRFNVWCLNPAPSTSRDQTPTWIQRSQGSFGNVPIYQAISSSDASMIATACGSVITLWDPVTNALCASLAHPETKDHVLKILFAGIPSSSNGESQTTEIPCIVGLTKQRCHVWNLLTASIWWTLELGGAMIATASDADTGQFAIAVAEVSPSGSVQRTKILEFIVSSPAPTSSFFIKGELQGMLYIPSAQMPAGSSRSTSDRLFVLSADFEIERLGSGRSPGTSTATKAEAQDLDKSTGLLTGIYGSKVLDAPISQTSANRKPNSSANTIRSDSEKSLAFMQTTASHLLPPPVKLADAFFEAILRKKESLSDEPILWTHEVEIKADESAMVIDRDIAPQNTSPDEDSLNGMEYLADVMTGLVLGKGKTLDELPASTKTPEKSKDAKVKREKVGSSSKKK